MEHYQEIYESLHEKGYNLKHLTDKITVSKAELIDLIDHHVQKLRNIELKKETIDVTALGSDRWKKFL